MINILILVGGIGRTSLNKQLFTAVKERIPPECRPLTFDISKLPFFSQDLEGKIQGGKCCSLHYS